MGTDWAVLEGFYYGSHYIIGSAARVGRFAPGLWGPCAQADSNVTPRAARALVSKLEISEDRHDGRTS